MKSSEKNTPPSSYKRNEYGLISNVDYVFNEDGSVDWRSMIKEEHLFPNKGWFDARKKTMPKSISGLKDHQLLIKLGGIKELAKLRGFTSVQYKTVKCDQDHVAVSCSITFLPNYETGDNPVVFEDMANATLNNTSSFATKFLETIACNRAFVRAVRNFLNVHIVGLDEMDTSEPQSNLNQENNSPSFSIHSMLDKIARENINCFNFECFKEYLLELKESGIYINKQASEWNKYSDIPSKECRVLLKILKD